VCSASIEPDGVATVAVAVQCYYGMLLLWPRELCCEYSFDCIKSLDSLADPRAAALVPLAAAALAAAAVVVRALRLAARRGGGGDDGTLARLCCVAWLVLPYTPASGLLVRCAAEGRKGAGGKRGSGPRGARVGWWWCSGANEGGGGEERFATGTAQGCSALGPIGEQSFASRRDTAVNSRRRCASE
jgi:hypothetical protein